MESNNLTKTSYFAQCHWGDDTRHGTILNLVAAGRDDLKDQVNRARHAHGGKPGFTVYAERIEFIGSVEKGTTSWREDRRVPLTAQGSDVVASSRAAREFFDARKDGLWPHERKRRA